MLEQRIQQHFIDAADLQFQAAQALAGPIAAAVQAAVACITAGGKVLACGLGASAAAAQQLAALCVAGFERERPELAALALGADTGLLSAESAFAAQPQAAFARQVRALGQLGDVLLMLSVTGDEPALLAALEAAHERELMVLLLTGRSGGALAQRLRETDVLIGVPHDRPARVREVHTLVLHCLCDGIDAQLLGEEESS